MGLGDYFSNPLIGNGGIEKDDANYYVLFRA